MSGAEKGPFSAAAAPGVPSLVLAELPEVPVFHLTSLVHFCDVISARQGGNRRLSGLFT